MVLYILIIIDAEGPVLIKLDPERLKAVTEFPIPKNKTELRRLLGLKTQVQA